MKKRKNGSSIVEVREEKKDDNTVNEQKLANKIISNMVSGLDISVNDPRIISKLALISNVPLNGNANDVLAAVGDIFKNEKKVPFIYYTGAGTLKVDFREATVISRVVVPGTSFVQPRLMLLHTYAITTFADDYGAGKIISTFSLLPNEKTKITMKTWKTSEVVSKQASSIFDSYSVDTANEFESTVQNEITNRNLFKESRGWNAGGGISGIIPKVNIGLSLKGGAEKSTQKEVENTVKNIDKTVSNYSNNVSSKRNIEIKTSIDTTVKVGEENLIERELENVNAGRVLNFVFRHLQQIYLTYIHLVDIRVAFVYYDNLDPVNNPMKPEYREYSLSELEDFLESHLKETGTDESTPPKQVNPRDEVRNWIVGELTLNDYKNRPLSIIECVEVKTGKTTPLSDYLDRSKRLDTDGKQKLMLRIVKNKYYQNENPPGTDPEKPPFYEKHVVDGIILARNEHIMPTDSVIVEALLGQSEGLDKYSIESRRAVIDLKRTEIDKMSLAEEVVREEEEKKAEIFEKVYRPPKTIIKEGDSEG